MRWPLVVRRAHKWLSLLVGAQLVLWTLTGVYMVIVHLDFIHGDHLVRPAAPPPDAAAARLPAGGAYSEMRLTTLLGRPVWRVEGPGGARLLDASTGRLLPPLSQAQAQAVAASRYAGEGAIVSTRLVRERLQEMGSRRPPYWQVQFAGWSRPTLYLDPGAGELLAKRHLAWRIFDVAWMLHIMDYDKRSDVNNWLLRAVALSALGTSLAGAWLLLWTLPRRRKRKAARA